MKDVNYSLFDLIYIIYYIYMKKKTIRASKRRSFNRTKKNNSFKRKTMKKRGGFFSR